MNYISETGAIPGNTFFDGKMSKLGYPLNKMCYSFNSAAAREAFKQDEEAYCDLFGLTSEQKQAVKNRDLLAMIQLGGSIYYLAKLAGILGLDVQDCGALQTGMSKQAFVQMLVAAGE